MTIDEAIAYNLRIAEGQDKCADISVSEHAKERMRECAANNRQLAEWLTELKELEATEVQPIKHGRWLGDEVIQCSNCNFTLNGASYGCIVHKCFNYCPKCGARMDLND